MTCIVGLEHKGKVYIGGDRCQSDLYMKTMMDRPKVFVKDDIAFGYTSSFRFGNLLQHSLKVPSKKYRKDTNEFVYVYLVEAIRKCLKKGGYAHVSNAVERGGNCLFGYKGKLYQMQDDFSVINNSYGYDAVGSGWFAAYGSFYSSGVLGVKDPKARVMLALETAAALVPSVSGPFDIISV